MFINCKLLRYGSFFDQKQINVFKVPLRYVKAVTLNNFIDILKKGITVTVYILKRKLSFFLFILIKILIDPCLCMIEKFFVKKNICFYVMQMEHIHKAYLVKECVRLRSNLISLIREGYKLTNLRCDKIISTLVSLRL